MLVAVAVILLAGLTYVALRPRPEPRRDPVRVRVRDDRRLPRR